MPPPYRPSRTMPGPPWMTPTGASSSPARCRDDAEQQRAMRAALLASEPGIESRSPQPPLQKLMARIDELEREWPAGPTQASLRVHERTAPAPHASHRVPTWLAAALVVQAVGLTWIGVALWHGSTDPTADAPYRTLTAPGSASMYGDAPQVRVVLA